MYASERCSHFCYQMAFCIDSGKICDDITSYWYQQPNHEHIILKYGKAHKPYIVLSSTRTLLPFRFVRLCLTAILFCTYQWCPYFVHWGECVWISHFLDEISEICDKTCSSSLIYREMIHAFGGYSLHTNRMQLHVKRPKTANHVTFVVVAVAAVVIPVEQRCTLASIWHKITFRLNPINLLRFIFLINPLRWRKCSTAFIQ